MEQRAGALREHRLRGATLLADYGGPVLAVTVVREGVVRIRLAPQGSFPPVARGRRSRRTRHSPRRLCGWRSAGTRWSCSPTCSSSGWSRTVAG
jgi:hypothetical protein